MARRPWRGVHGAGWRQSLVSLWGHLGGGGDGGDRHHRGHGGPADLENRDRR